MSELALELLSQLKKNVQKDPGLNSRQQKQLNKIYRKINTVVDDYTYSKDPLQANVLVLLDLTKSRTGTYYIGKNGEIELHEELRNYLNMMKKLTEIARRSRY